MGGETIDAGTHDAQTYSLVSLLRGLATRGVPNTREYGACDAPSWMDAGQKAVGVPKLLGKAGIATWTKGGTMTDDRETMTDLLEREQPTGEVRYPYCIEHQETLILHCGSCWVREQDQLVTSARELTVALRLVLRSAGKSGQVDDKYRVIPFSALRAARKILQEQGYE